ncbi:hypothetical protein [Brevibacillus sp. BC25]|uniref:hypothetical protein n=1 Tax=Brevibacillus sp. BC25 TaxID=1144308 RepID=UPI000270F4EB|nr:hypothetical protein [Brevibacillus sp. BC25]EJL25686.1 hypothetical protein PMI05_03750 [Brevibacillus sp. BC25]
MKKMIISSVAIMALLIGGVISYSESNTTQNQKDYRVAMSQANFKVFKDLNELEEFSGYIVQANFTGDRSLKEWNLGEGEIKTASKSKVTIQKVYKGSLEEGNEISVYEPAYFENDVFDTIEGYNLMSEDGTYMLFLRDTDDKEGYAIIGMYQGKYDIGADKQKIKAKQAMPDDTYRTLEDREYFGDNIDQFNNLKEEVLRKYK